MVYSVFLVQFLISISSFFQRNAAAAAEKLAAVADRINGQAAGMSNRKFFVY